MINSDIEVFVYSKNRFDELMAKNNITNQNVEDLKNIFFISINDTTQTDRIPYFENKNNVLVLFFDDVEEDVCVSLNGKNIIVKAFTSEQAVELLSFLRKQGDKKKCIVHCAAGISRSGAVGEFVNDYLGGDWYKFKKNNPYIHPNGLVLRTLKGELNKMKNFPKFWYDSNAVFGMVESIADLNDVIEKQLSFNKGVMGTKDDVLKNSLMSDTWKEDFPSFGTRIEHCGQQSLKDYLENYGIINI